MASIGFNEKVININGANIKTKATAIKKDEVTYLPINELLNVYDVQMEYLKNTDIVTLDSLDKEQTKATACKNVSVKLYARNLSRTVDKLKQGAMVVVISEKDGWTKVRTENGKIGYIKNNKLTNYIKIRDDMQAQKQISGKINLFWDYYSEYVSAPDRTGEYIQGVNVVSPTMFYIDSNGKFVEKSKYAAKKYVEWAHSNNYKVWALVSNDKAGIKTTSSILQSYEERTRIIEEILRVSTEYGLDGINIDFENMYQDDKDNFSQFIIELAPRMREIGLVTSVDVTAPDGSPTWSLCFDRIVLGKVADYLMFMAYDQFGSSSNKAGTTAGYDWVELGINKFLKTHEVDSNKLILGLPLYTRLWTETANGEVSSKTVNMKDIDSTLSEANSSKVWNDDLKQFYIEYASGSTTKKMWIEDITSIKAKVSLVNKYNLGGVASWEKDREDEAVWSVIEEELKK